MALRIEIPASLIEKLLRKMVPLVSETINLFEEAADEDGIPPKLKNKIAQYQVEPWAGAYENFDGYFSSLVCAISAHDQQLDKLAPPENLDSLDAVQKWINNTLLDVERFIDEQFDDDSSLAFMDAIEPESWHLAPEDLSLTRQAVFLTVALVLFFNSVSCLVHRQSMFQLIAQAKAGDDDSFLKAIQIDKTCLTGIPYFRERLERAPYESDVKFLVKVAEYKKRPILQSQNEYPLLYFILSMLDSIGILNASAKRLDWFATLCSSLGAYRDQTLDNFDAASFGKVITRFKKQYRTLSLNPIFSNKIFVVVKDTKLH